MTRKPEKPTLNRLAALCGWEIIPRARTVGALNRRFQRDMEFQRVPTISGPAVTPAGNDNGDMALRFGTYPPIAMPRHWWRFVLGEHAAKWCRLSDMDAAHLIVSARFCVRLA